MPSLNFDHRWVNTLPGDQHGGNQPRQTPGVAWCRAEPTPVADPRLLMYSPQVAALLELSETELTAAPWVNALAGNSLLPGMVAFATRYGGHQFGQWAGQLGDGRAIGLGELVNSQQQRWELQLKGAGMTPYSRRADGRAVLRSSIREFLCSEAMFHLGVPTTRALSLVATGEQVVRDMFYNGNPQAEPGAVVCRVAPSFVRFGHLQIYAAQGELDLLRQVVELVISRDFPHLNGPFASRLLAWFVEVCESTARLMVEWMRVGFVHGVMNTDNMSILGLTIDYGPYGWLEDFEPGWTPNTTDASTRRYCYGNQPDIARWNLQRLAEALLPITPDPAYLEQGLAAFDATLFSQMQHMLAAKFGLLRWEPSSDEDLVSEVFELMQRCEVDYSLFFRQLAQIDPNQPDWNLLQAAFYQPPLLQSHFALWQNWFAAYAQRLQQQNDTPAERAGRMNQVNPAFILRNYLSQQAIVAAEQGDLSAVEALFSALQHPYDDLHPPQLLAKRPECARHLPGASMLSCSS